MEAVKRQRYISEAAWLSLPYAKFAISFFSPLPPFPTIRRVTEVYRSFVVIQIHVSSYQN